jgi:hypothetical protein
MIEQCCPHQEVCQVYHERGKEKRRFYALREGRVLEEGFGIRPHRPKIKDREKNSEPINDGLHGISCNNLRHLKNCLSPSRKCAKILFLESICDFASGEAIPSGFARATLLGLFRSLNFITLYKFTQTLRDKQGAESGAFRRDAGHLLELRCSP